MMETILHWLAQYGYLGLFSLLMVGIIGLPVPDETLLAFAGYLVFRHDLNLFPTVAAALLGSICGISVSYALGRAAGPALIRKYGRYVHLTSERVRITRDWFERMGKWSLLVGYFVPGVRHMIALIAGASKLRYPVFAFFAYTGGLVWSLTFFSLGFFFGREWASGLARVQAHIVLIAAGGLTLLLAYVFVQGTWNRRRR